MMDITPVAENLIRFAQKGLRECDSDSASAAAFREILKECGAKIPDDTARIFKKLSTPDLARAMGSVEEGE
jgi:hypothetical protein